ncbi:ATP-binding protein [Polyangium sp. y55x31]|uniref:hybrid sensor histidine kinase/response regulator n=1 Tax=Polyangium sp. y55x31 TaxID=3042688 RepID=UPI00248259E1|nr:ATP-binding protein [Polyangium sp. y55x31]MDI1482824.1 ATP-binding protein [Polyangium sp. y55x31]
MTKKDDAFTSAPESPLVAHDLLRRVEEAEATLAAIRAGEVDALVVSADGTPRVFVLKGADHAHRTLLETLNEGAMTISGDGTILFANRKVAEMLGRPLSKVLGASLRGCVGPEEAATFDALLGAAKGGSAKGELSLEQTSGARLPVMLSIRDAGEEDPTFTVVATDLTPLKAAEAALRQANDELEARVAARTAELVKANEALREADRRKDEFLSMLGHELRNPLAPILTAAEMIRVATHGDARVERFRGVIERQARNLSRLVDDLLDVSRITRGTITLQTKLVDLGTIVRSAVDAARPLVDASGHTLRVALPAAPVLVEGDPTRLEQVIVNLLNNAAKYTERGGEITLSVVQDKASVTATVKDNGIGMPAELLPRVFDLFVQGERALDRSQGGLGIGLTLVKSLITMHGGSVEARSEGVGKGSEIVVRLPHVRREGPNAKAQAAEEAPASAQRALVVEDNADAADMLSELLGLWGYDVRAAQSGEEGVSLAATFRPHVVLLDIGLPGMDGFEVARRLRATWPTSQALLIGVSGYGQEADRRKAEEAGIDHQLMKPLDPQVLHGLLERSKGRRARRS